MIITRFENSELPVTEIDFPAVTVCSQGLNMDNVAKAVERDFTEWHLERRRKKGRRRREAGEESLQTLMSIYLKEKFDINEDDPSILDIIQSTSAIGGGGAAKAEAVTKSVKQCSEGAGVSSVPNPKENQKSDDMYPDDDNDDSLEARKDCAVMRDWGLLSNNYTVITDTEGQDCIHHCYRAPDCRDTPGDQGAPAPLVMTRQNTSRKKVKGGFFWVNIVHFPLQEAFQEDDVPLVKSSR